MTTTEYRAQLLQAVNALPEEYLPYLLQLVQTFSDSVTLKSAAESLRQGWQEARNKEIRPIDELWDGIDAE